MRTFGIVRPIGTGQLGMENLFDNAPVSTCRHSHNGVTIFGKRRHTMKDRGARITVQQRTAGETDERFLLLAAAVILVADPSGK